MGFKRISTVQTAAASKDLVALATVKSALQIQGSDENAYLKLLIASTSAAVMRYCNRVFVAETVLDEFWPDRDPYPFQLPGGLKELQLSRWPVISLTSVTENSLALVAGTDFRTDGDVGHLIRLGGNAYPVPWSPWPIAAIHNSGFATIPADVQEAVIRMIKARRLGRTRDPYERQRNIPGVIEQSWWIATGDEAGNMPPDVADILDNYRVPIIG